MLTLEARHELAPTEGPTIANWTCPHCGHVHAPATPTTPNAQMNANIRAIANEVLGGTDYGGIATKYGLTTKSYRPDCAPVRPRSFT